MSSRRATRSASAIARSVSTSSGIVACCTTSASSSIACGAWRAGTLIIQPKLSTPALPVTVPPSSSASSAIWALRRAVPLSAARTSSDVSPACAGRLVAAAAQHVHPGVDHRARLPAHEHRDPRRRAEDVHAAFLLLGAQPR